MDISQLKVGSAPGADIYFKKDFLVLASSVKSSPDLIQSLQFWSLDQLVSKHAYAGREKRDSMAFLNFIYPDSSLKARLIHAHSTYRYLSDFQTNIMEDYVRNKTIHIENTTEIVKAVLNMIKKESFIFFVMHYLKDQENYWVSHSLNTTLVSLAIGRELGFSHFNLINLGIAALLHEISMLRLPKRFLEHGNPLTDREKDYIRLHSLLSVKILQPLKLSNEITSGVMEHHERYDGSGYPRGMRGHEISLFGRILGVACSYAAQLSSRPFREGKEAYLSIISLLSSSRETQYYDPAILNSFIRAFSLYPLGTVVELDDGSVGFVMKTHPENPGTPMIYPVFDSEGRLLKRVDEYIDLSQVEMKVKCILSWEQLLEKMEQT